MDEEVLLHLGEGDREGGGQHGALHATWPYCVDEKLYAFSTYSRKAPKVIDPMQWSYGNILLIGN